MPPSSDGTSGLGARRFGRCSGRCARCCATRSRRCWRSQPWSSSRSAPCSTPGTRAGRPIQALYFCVVTLATVGYGDLHPTNELSQLFTIAYILSSVGIIAAFVTELAKHRPAEGRQGASSTSSRGRGEGGGGDPQALSRGRGGRSPFQPLGVMSRHPGPATMAAGCGREARGSPVKEPKPDAFPHAARPRVPPVGHAGRRPAAGRGRAAGRRPVAGSHRGAPCCHRQPVPDGVRRLVGRLLPHPAQLLRGVHRRRPEAVERHGRLGLRRRG